MRQIYLVRHGVIDYKSLGLAPEGLAYARRLSDLLPDPIDFLASDEEARCVATMEPLAAKRSLVQLGFPAFNDATRDSSYEQILVYTDNANTVSRKTIATGQKRPPRR
jgi:broad specificity phosphatase PhoE